MSHSIIVSRSAACVLSILAVACQQSEEPTEFRSIVPVCVEEEAPADAWTCDEPLTIDCNDAEVPEEIYVELDACGEVELVPIDGPFGPGEHEIIVLDDAGDEAICTTQLTITDAVAPIVETTTLSLWPPNHKMHAFELADCIVEIDDCDPDTIAVIDYITSDEPLDDRGDGNTEPDIELVGPDAFAVRSERQGGSNGRVYGVAFTVTDGSGNSTAATCEIVVDHDQGKGAAIADAEAYRVEA